MKRIRIGNDILVRWTVTRNGDPEDFGTTDVTVQLLDYRSRQMPIETSISGNVIEVMFRGRHQSSGGAYKLVLMENRDKDGMITIDHTEAFELVPKSIMTGGSTCSNIEISTVELSDDLSTGIPGPKGEDAKINGYNAIEIVAGRNVEIRQEDEVLTISAEGGGGGGSKPYESLIRKGEYLYDISFARIPEYIPGNASPNGGCTSFVRDGKLYRNLDWKYDDTPSFIVHTKEFDGMAYDNGINDSSMSDVMLGQLPYMVVDGVNRHGIMAATHVLYNDWDWHGEGSIPLTKALYEILTNVQSMATIESDCADIVGSLSTTPALDAAEYLLQFLITDGVTTYVLTPSADGYELLDATANPKMTNFKWVAESEVERDAVNMQLRPTGVERWNAIGGDTELSDLRFTMCYESSERLSEFVGIDDTTKDSADADLRTIYDRAHAAYLIRTRDGQLWQTMHSVVYGVNGMEHLWCQESWHKDYVAQGGGGGEFEQVNSDWEATSGKARILNKPFYSKPGNKVFEINGETAFLVTSGMENWIYGYHSMVLPWSLDTEVTVTIDGHTVNTKLHSGIVEGKMMMPLIGNLEAARAMLYFILGYVGGGMIPVVELLSDVKSLIEEGEPLFMGNFIHVGSDVGFPFIIVNTNVIEIESESSITIDINGHTQTVGIEQIISEGEFIEGLALCSLDDFILYHEIPACDVDIDGDEKHLKCIPVDNVGIAEVGPVLSTPLSGIDPESDICGFVTESFSIGVSFLTLERNPNIDIHSISVYSGDVRTAYFGNVIGIIDDYQDGFFKKIISTNNFDKDVYVLANESLQRYNPEKKLLWWKRRGSYETYGYEISSVPQKLAFESHEFLPITSLCAFTDTINKSPISVYECDEKLLPSYNVVHERQRAIFDDFVWCIRIENPGEAVLFGYKQSIPEMPQVFYCGNAVSVIGTDEDQGGFQYCNGIVFTPLDNNTVLAKRMFGINADYVNVYGPIEDEFFKPMTFSTLIDENRNQPSRIKMVSDRTTPPNIQYCRDLYQYDDLIGEYCGSNNWVDLKFHKNSDGKWESEELNMYSKEVSVDDSNIIIKGDISFRGNNPSGLTEIVNGEHKTTRFVIDGECMVYGNPITLLSGDFKALSIPYAGFESLFEDCSGIIEAYLSLGVLSIGNYACYRMFKNSGLEYCRYGDYIAYSETYCGEYAFAEMFAGSNLYGLDSAPLAGKNSACRMLANCTNLEWFYLSESPLEDSYKEIAAGCSNLQEVYLVGGFTIWNDGIGTKDWLKNTPATGTLYCQEQLGTDETIERGADYCPEGWTVDNNIN